MAIHYENRNGVCFDVEVEDANVPQGANYWGYRLIAQERQTGKSYSFLAMIRKHQCRTKETADRFLKDEPIKYLKSALLDAYSDGKTPLLWPNLLGGWVVV